MSDDPKQSSKPIVFRGSLWKESHARKAVDETAKECSIAGICATCQHIDLNYSAGLEKKLHVGLDVMREAGLLQGTHIMPVSPSPKVTEYRTHAKLAVREASKGINQDPGDRFAIGLFKPRTHDVVNIDRCPLHKNSITQLIQGLRVALNNSEITPYDEGANRGDLRYIAIRASHLTRELMLTFVVMDENRKRDFQEMVMLLRREGHKIVSAHLNINAEITNVIFGSLSKRLVGSDRLRARLCHLSFEIGPTSFFQVNPWQAENIYHRVAQLAGQNVPREVAWDLYCGTGQMSLLLAKAGYRVLGIEENPQAIRDAQMNANRNNTENPPSFIIGRVEELRDSLPLWTKRPSLIVVNPSRKGLGKPVQDLIKTTLENHEESKLIYVSCEVTTLARDLKMITESGRRLRQLESFDMFPFTDKMEWLAVIS